MHIARFKIEDTLEIMRLFYNTVHHTTADNYSKEQRDAWAPAEMLHDDQVIKRWQGSLRKNMTFVAKYHNQIIGFADLAEQGYLDRLYVHHHFQKRGIACKLLAEIEHAARHQRHKTVETNASMTSKPFFEKHDFQVIQKQTVHRHDVALINYKMKKSLK